MISGDCRFRRLAPRRPNPRNARIFRKDDSVTALDFDRWFETLAPGASNVVTAPIVHANSTNSEYDLRRFPLVWSGPPDVAMLTRIGCGKVDYHNVKVIVDKPLLSVFDLTVSPVAGPVSTNCKTTGVEVSESGSGYQYGIRVDHRNGEGPNQNNDCHEFIDCTFNGPTKAMAYLFGTQAMLCSFQKFGGNGLNVTPNCIVHESSLSVDIAKGGGAGLTGYAYVFGQSYGGGQKIDGPVWETTRGGLLKVIGNAVTGTPMSVSNVRFHQLGGDGLPVIDMGKGIPSLLVQQTTFGVQDDGGRWKPITILVDCQPPQSGATAASCLVQQCTFTQPSSKPKPDPIPLLKVSSNVRQFTDWGNQWWVDGKLMAWPGDRVRPRF